MTFSLDAVSASSSDGDADPEMIGRRLAEVRDAVEAIVLGKGDVVRRALCGLLAGGHLLMSDEPGVGKTTLGSALARLLGLHFKRVPFTSDLLPSDILGANVYNRTGEQFVFHPGPVFSHVLLADEINRASPRTQSALLEAMEERRVSIEGVTRPLPAPFFVIATQNPLEQHGTFPLPESQLDRFLMSVSLGVPDRAAERRMLQEPPRAALLENLEPVLGPEEVTALQARAAEVHVSEPVTEYLLDLVHQTRTEGAGGLSPRAGLALQRAARAWALLDGRDYVTPDDVQAIAPSVLDHRLGGAPATQRLLDTVAVP